MVTFKIPYVLRYGKAPKPGNPDNRPYRYRRVVPPLLREKIGTALGLDAELLDDLVRDIDLTPVDYAARALVHLSGVPQDHEQAMRLFHQAAEAGETRADNRTDAIQQRSDVDKERGNRACGEDERHEWR